MSAIASNLQAVIGRIANAASLSDRRKGDIALIAVSKTFPPAAVREAIAAGQGRFGESYVQEAVMKMDELDAGAEASFSPEWHMIGPVQTNKTRIIAEHFDWVHSLDRLSTAERLSRQRPLTRGPLNVLLQVNVSGEGTKGGVAPEQLHNLILSVRDLPNLRLRGLMAIPAPAAQRQLQRRPFAQMRQMLDDAMHLAGADFDQLSMGMSDDLEAAIAEGATMIRVGTAIFGARERATGVPP